MSKKNWYESKTGNHQGLVIDEDTGANIAVTYDKKDAALIAAAPALYEVCKTAAGYWLLNQFLKTLDDDQKFVLSQLEAALSLAEGGGE